MISFFQIGQVRLRKTATKFVLPLYRIFNETVTSYSTDASFY